MKSYSSALHQIRIVQQDPGFASLCSRASQRLFQEHLLPEVEGWSHRLEPDPIRQVDDKLEHLLSCAAIAQEELKKDIAPRAVYSADNQWHTLGVYQPSGVNTALWVLDPGVKTKEEAQTKALVKY